MTSVRTGGKSDVISCHFEFFKVLTLFSTRLLLEMMYFTVQTVTEPKKNDFKSWNPTSELQNLRKQPKTMKMTPKMTETIRGTCGGQRGTVGDRFGVTYEGSWSNQKPENSFETRLCSSKTIKNHRFIADFWELLSQLSAYKMTTYWFRIVSEHQKDHSYNDNHRIHHIAEILKSWKWQEMTSDFPPVRTEVTVQVYP